MANVLKSLEKKGFVAREKDPEDGRKTCIIITEMGLAECKRIFQEAERKYQAVVQRVGEENVAAYISLTEKVLSAYQEVNDEMEEKAAQGA